MDLTASDTVFVIGVLAVFAGAFAQDRMRRALRRTGRKREAAARGLGVARHYAAAIRPRGDADQGKPMESWPLWMFYIGSLGGTLLLACALAMLFLISQ